MRIIGGRARGLQLTPLGEGDAAAHLRPTSDRVREAMFNLLINGGYGNPLAEARVLDLFAGTGALGLEALSRGASHATFADDGAVALSILKRNIALMRAQAETEILRRDATKLGENRGRKFSMLFLDPPYAKGVGEIALASCLAGNWLAPGALVIWEESSTPAHFSGLDRLDQRKYGDTYVTICRVPQ